MKLSDVIKVWDFMHLKNISDLGFCDLEKAIDQVVGVENDCKTLEEIRRRETSFIGVVK